MEVANRPVYLLLLGDGIVESEGCQFNQYAPPPGGGLQYSAILSSFIFPMVTLSERVGGLYSTSRYHPHILIQASFDRGYMTQ